ncbi:MAG: ATP-binding protein [Acidobacteria bacterium]|nr:ATP-binding protein [Acidobacteriota bacterium]
MLPRLLKIALPEKQSAFLWGPRKTGKSTYLKAAYPNSLVIDLLDTDQQLEFLKRPALLRERLLAASPEARRHPVIIDEVQKVPALLDEVQWLIESKSLRFILCGSSARKLTRGRANLLGGRAWRFEMFPLTSAELGEVDLLRALNRGLVPDHYFGADPGRSLAGYVRDYLKEEILAEGLTRNVPAFSRFLDAVGHSHGELTNYANIARDCGVDAKTVKEYYQILADTLLGRLVEPFQRRSSRQVITRAPKAYLFDVGVAGGLVRRRLELTKGEVFGKALEHFILMEMTAHSSYSGLNYPIRFWRTKSGQEVDFVLGDGEVAVEVKGAGSVDTSLLRGLKAFAEEFNPRLSILVGNERHERLVGSIRIMPWRCFLEELWAGKIVS